MREASDTTLRYIALLTCLPVRPDRISTYDLKEKLARINPDYNVSLRTIQRDLDKLSADFPLNCDHVGRGKYWYWAEKDSLTQIPAMNESSALALRLAEDYLQPVMPPVTMRLLRAYFQQAREVLRGTRLNHWVDSVRIINRGPELIPPTIRQDVQEAVYEALLKGKQLRVTYKRRGNDRSRERILHPLGLVTRNGIIYLVATAWKYEDPWHFALHRMTSSEVLDDPISRPENFSLDEHVHNDREFAYPISNRPLKLKLLVNEHIAEHLSECCLSKDQKITRKRDGTWLVEAAVMDTEELRWWLLGFGTGIEVMSPARLRKEFKEYCYTLHSIYDE